MFYAVLRLLRSRTSKKSTPLDPSAKRFKGDERASLFWTKLKAT